MLTLTLLTLNICMSAPITFADYIRSLPLVTSADLHIHTLPVTSSRQHLNKVDCLMNEREDVRTVLAGVLLGRRH